MLIDAPLSLSTIGPSMDQINGLAEIQPSDIKKRICKYINNSWFLRNAESNMENNEKALIFQIRSCKVLHSKQRFLDRLYQ